jgi:tetratricopeptide (TPR) repeat protein
MIRKWGYKMDKRAIICLCLVILFSTSTYATRYVGTHFTIESNLSPRLVEGIRQRADAFYTNLTKNYSLPGWMFPLTIYYSKDESQTNQLLSKYGFVYLKGNSYYITDSPSVYVHRYDDKGQASDPCLLFCGITRHFIAQNLKNVPEWFREGLPKFFAEQTGIVNGKLVVSGPKPDTNHSLKDKIEKGSRPNIKTLFSWTTPEKLHSLPYGCHLAQEFFYWLHDTNQLAAYLYNVQKEGFDLSVLEKTVSKDFGKINIDLLNFLNKTCYAEAHFSEALRTDNHTKKEEILIKTLELKPDYHKARLELVKSYHKGNDLPKCKGNLEQILSAPLSPEHMPAAVLMGNLYYTEKDYKKAIVHYTKAWDYSTNYDYRYRIAYRLANSCNHLKNASSARQWYETFLTNKWDPDDMKLCADYAQKYVEYSKKIDMKTHAAGKKPKTKL